MYQLFLIFYRKTKVKDEFYKTKIRQDSDPDSVALVLSGFSCFGRIRIQVFWSDLDPGVLVRILIRYLK